MKVLLIANYLPDHQESMLRYARMLSFELGKRGHQVKMVSPPVNLLKRIDAESPLAKWIAYFDKYILARSALRAECRWADVVHVCDHSNAMYLALAHATPSVITCHDLLAVFAARGRYPGIVVGRTGRLLQRWIASSLLRARRVICVSHQTAADLKELADGHPPPSTVVHNPLNWEYEPAPASETRRILEARGLAQVGEYLFHIGSNAWYKNRPAVVRIFAALKRSPAFGQASLVMAGEPWSPELRALVAASGQAAHIYELHGVTNEELRALYSGASALLFPSREEGFGWPILEAQACGCPVITTNHAPMTEVAGGAAILVDPDEPEAAAAIILREMPRSPELRAAGLKNVTRFSMSGAIDGYLSAYEMAIREQAGIPA